MELEKELSIQEEISHSSDNSDLCEGETGAETAMGSWWVGLHLDHRSLVMHTFNLLFKSTQTCQDSEDRLAVVSLFAPLPDVATLDKYRLYPSSLLFDLHIGNR